MKRAVIFISFILGTTFFSGSASALQLSAAEQEVVYGQAATLRVQGGSDTLRLLAFPFPYRQSTEVGTWPGTTRLIRVVPQRNTFYRLLRVRKNEVVERSRPLKIWVRPQINYRFRKTGNYLFAGGSILLSDYFSLFYSQLRSREQRIYLYQRCSRYWNLVRSFPLRSRTFSPDLLIAWQGSSRLRCSGYRVIGTFSFPEVLPSGDEGLGKPRLSRQELQIASRLLGRRQIHDRNMKKFFP